MLLKWYDVPEFKQIPFICRMWLWYCAYGPKRNSGGTWGGNKLYDAMHWYLKNFSHRNSSLMPINIPRWNLDIVVDLLDFESYHHTIPIASGGNSEMFLQDLLLTPGDTFVDIGANYGLFSLHASTLIGSEGHIIAIEPNPRLAEALRMTKKLNHLNQILVVESAISDHIGRANFFISNKSSGISSLFQSHAEQQVSSGSVVTEVQLDTLDQLLNKANLSSITLIKIDVEGAEMEVFRGARLTIISQKPFLWFEVNPSALRHANIESELLFSYLNDLGYSAFYDISSFNDKLACRKLSNLNVSELTNVLAVHAERLLQLEQFIQNIKFKLAI